MALATLALGGCPRAGTPADTAPDAGMVVQKDVRKDATRRLTLALTSEPDVLLPLLSTSGAAQEVTALVARDLVLTDPTWATVPDLAAGLPRAVMVDGKLTVTWRIRDDARWEDGVPLTAADVIAAWRIQLDERQEIVAGRDNARRIESIVPVADDERSFVVTWKETTPFFADPRVHVPLPAHQLRDIQNGQLKDHALARRPLANGPFRLVEHAAGQHLLFRRNDAWVPRAELDEVLVKIVPSTASALTMLRAGDVDAIFPSGGPSPVEAAAFAKAHGDVVVKSAPGQVWTHIDFNLDDPWLADVRVRRALALAIPREDIFRSLSGGLYETAQTYLPPRHWGHAALPPLPFDAARARELLDEAGWTMPQDGRASDGVRRNERGDRLHLELAAASEVKETADLLQLVVKAWRDVGVEVRLDLRPFKVFFGEGARKRKLKHMSFYSWTLDGTSMGGALWRKDKIPSEANGYNGQNLPGWKNDEATALLKRADATLELEERRRMLRRVQGLVRDELPAIPMYFRPVVVVHRRGVHGLEPTGTLTPLAWNAATWSKDGAQPGASR